jgi:hypothetical protein
VIVVVVTDARERDKHLMVIGAGSHREGVLGDTGRSDTERQTMRWSQETRRKGADLLYPRLPSFIAATYTADDRKCVVELTTNRKSEFSNMNRSTSRALEV